MAFAKLQHSENHGQILIEKDSDTEMYLIYVKFEYDEQYAKLTLRFNDEEARDGHFDYLTLEESEALIDESLKDL